MEHAKLEEYMVKMNYMAKSAAEQSLLLMQIMQDMDDIKLKVHNYLTKTLNEAKKITNLHPDVEEPSSEAN